MLDRNPENFFTDNRSGSIRASKYRYPALVPGQSNMLLGRMFSNPDTTSLSHGPVSCNCRSTHQNEVHSYNKDGAMHYHQRQPTRHDAPRSYGGPKAILRVILKQAGRRLERSSCAVRSFLLHSRTMTLAKQERSTAKCLSNGQGSSSEQTSFTI